MREIYRMISCQINTLSIREEAVIYILGQICLKYHQFNVVLKRIPND